MDFDHFRELKTKDITEANIILGSASYDMGCSCGKGTSLAPSKLRTLSAYLPIYDANFHKINNIKIFDYGDFIPSNKIDYFKLLENKANEILNYNKFMLFFGGDHSISIPLEKAFYNKYHHNFHPVIIHLDAHMDILDTYMGSKFSHACPNRRALDNGYQVEDINMIGIRSYEEDEVNFKNEHPELNVVTSFKYKELGAKEVIKQIKNRYGDDAVYYVSFDIDIVDPGFAPGTGTPEAFGLTSLEMRELLLEIFNNLDVRAMDLVEISPSLDVNDITSWLGLKLLYEIFNVMNTEFK